MMISQYENFNGCVYLWIKSEFALRLAIIILRWKTVNTMHFSLVILLQSDARQTYTFKILENTIELY